MSDKAGIFSGKKLCDPEAQCQEEPGRKSQMIYRFLKVFNAKEILFRKLTTNPARKNNKVLAGNIFRKLHVAESSVDGCRILTVSPEKKGTRHIILLHGGAFVGEAMKAHQFLMEKLALKYGFNVTFVDYPLAPEHQATETTEVVLKVYLELLSVHSSDDFYLLGDSAGGGLALTLLQLLKAQNNARRPVKTVLLSPWLDLSMQNPEIDPFIEKEVLLSVDGLRICGKQYAGALDLQDPLVSPIEGDLNALHHLKVFVSTHEVFYPDCLLLKEKIEQSEGTSIELSIKYKMVHDWVMIPTPERDQTIDEIAQFFS